MEAKTSVVFFGVLLYTYGCIHALGVSDPPPPEETLTPSTACVYVALVPELPSLFQLAISDDQCQSVANQITADIHAQAQAEGSVVLVDAGPSPTCEPNTIKVCVTFRSFDEGARLQSWIEVQVDFWRELLIVGSGNTCPPYIANNGYQLHVFVGGDGVVPNLPSACLAAALVPSCKSVYPDDFPKCKCTPRRASTPFAAIPFMDQAPGRKPNTTLFCFTIATVAASPPSNPCAKTKVLYKAEIIGSYFRRQSLVSVGLQPAGAPTMKFVKPSWGAKGDSTIKVSALYWSLEQAEGGRICLELDKGVDLNKFCLDGGNTCWISLFDESKHCCPTFSGTLF